jgi:nucleotide-binding universal stress UspA family protein
MINLTSILVPTDFSETSQVAVTYGAALARAFGARLTLMHVIPDGFGEEIIAAATLGMFQIAERSAGARLEKLLTPQERRDLRLECVVRTGHPEEEIVGHARTQGTDLIILATRGRSAMAHMLEGSVTEKLLRIAPCPVLIVRHPEHEFVMPETAAS